MKKVFFYFINLVVIAIYSFLILMIIEQQTGEENYQDRGGFYLLILIFLPTIIPTILLLVSNKIKKRIDKSFVFSIKGFLFNVASLSILIILISGQFIYEDLKDYPEWEKQYNYERVSIEEDFFYETKYNNRESCDYWLKKDIEVWANLCNQKEDRYEVKSGIKSLYIKDSPSRVVECNTNGRVDRLILNGKSIVTFDIGPVAGPACKRFSYGYREFFDYYWDFSILLKENIAECNTMNKYDNYRDIIRKGSGEDLTELENCIESKRVNIYKKIGSPPVDFATFKLNKN